MYSSSQTGHGTISSCCRPQRHSSSNANERQGVWRAPEWLSPQTWRKRPKREEAESFFGDPETWGKLTADTCIPLGGHWCCLRTWTAPTVRAHPAQKTSERRSRGRAVWCLALKNRLKVPLILTLPLFIPKLSYWRKALVDGGSLGPCGFPWEWLVCPLLHKGEAVQWFHFLALPQPRSRMTWHTDNLGAWKPKTSTLFFLRVLELHQKCLPAGEINSDSSVLLFHL